MAYFHNMVKFLNELNLIVSWKTPSGLYINQKYIQFTKYDLKNTIMGKRKTIKLKKPKKKKNKTIIDKCKQINSFVPNFIHSMDGSNIVIKNEYDKINIPNKPDLGYIDLATQLKRSN